MQDKIIFYFIIYSFLGWCLESVYKSIIFKKVTNSGFLYGPFCPMYGIAAVLMLMLGNISNNIFVIFIISFLWFSVWEYIVAIVLEKLFKTKYWDYSDLKFNIHGRICLKNSIYWGILGVLLIFVIQPQIEKVTHLIPSSILIYIDVILCIAILVDMLITISKTMSIDKKVRQVFELSENIKEKIKELKNTDVLGKNYKETTQKLIEEMKEKQYILKIKVYKRIIRLRKAFPEMNSDNIAKFMTQKIELKDIKEKIKEHKNKVKDKKRNST